MKKTTQFSANIRKNIAYLVMTILCIAMFTTCAKNKIAPQSTVSSISPTSGPKATLVTINGSNFGNELDKVNVYFNEVKAVVQTVAASQITAIVPARAFTGLVKVDVNGIEAVGPEFNYIAEIQVSTFAGSSGGFVDGIGASAKFSLPQGVAVDSQGNLYVADFYNHKIRKVTPSGMVTTLAGGSQGFADGTNTAAKFSFPSGITIDEQDNIYVSDGGNHKIRQITLSGVVGTLAGSTKGFGDGTGASAKFNSPSGIAVDSRGNLYVVDSENNKIRKIATDGTVSTFAGSTSGDADGTGASAQFDLPQGITIDSKGNLYVADTYNHKIRKILPNGLVSTLAGSSVGFADGTGASAKFNLPFGVTIDSYGNLFVADSYNHRIRKITLNGLVSTVAGSIEDFADGAGVNAKFNLPNGIIIDKQNNFYVADTYNNKIRKITQE